MNKLLTCLAFIFTLSLTTAGVQAQFSVYQKHFETDDGIIRQTHMVRSTDGNYMIVASLDKAEGAADIQRPLLIKINDFGDILFQKQLPLEQSVIITDLAPHSDGGFTLAGVSRDAGTGNYENVVIFRTDAEGDLNWVRSLQHNVGADISPAFRPDAQVVETADNDVLVAVTAEVPTESRWLLAKFVGNSGVQSWESYYHIPGDENLTVSDMTRTADGGFAVLGLDRAPGDDGNGRPVYLARFGPQPLPQLQFVKRLIIQQLGAQDLVSVSGLSYNDAAPNPFAFVAANTQGRAAVIYGSRDGNSFVSSQTFTGNNEGSPFFTAPRTIDNGLLVVGTRIDGTAYDLLAHRLDENGNIETTQYYLPRKANGYNVTYASGTATDGDNQIFFLGTADDGETFPVQSAVHLVFTDGTLRKGCEEPPVSPDLAPPFLVDQTDLNLEIRDEFVYPLESSTPGRLNSTINEPRHYKYCTDCPMVNPFANLDQGGLEVCPGRTEPLDALNAGATYRWNTGATTQQIVPRESGVYSVVIEHNPTCVDSFSVSVSILPRPPIVFLENPVEDCQSLDRDNALELVPFNPLPEPVNEEIYYRWPDGSTADTFRITNPGTYEVDLTVIDSSTSLVCESIVNVTAIFHDLPEIDIYVSNPTPTPREVITLRDESPTSIKELTEWRFSGLDPDGTGKVTGEDTTLSYHNSGLNPYERDDTTREVTVFITDDNGCLNREEIDIQIKYPDAKMPKVFTPNGDGINDLFGPTGNGVTDYELYVYSSKGVSVFDGRNQRWDGTNGGTEVPPGVYFYIIEYETILDGPRIKRTGSVTVLR